MSVRMLPPAIIFWSHGFFFGLQYNTMRYNIVLYFKNTKIFIAICGPQIFISYLYNMISIVSISKTQKFSLSSIFVIVTSQYCRIL